MRITKENLNLHNIKRFFIALKRKFQIWFFSKTKAFFYDTSLEEYFNAPKHVREQFIWRINQMENSKQGRRCLIQGECMCGCAVPDLQLADDACEGNCYPAMMDEKKWNTFKIQNHFNVDLEREKVYKYIV